MALFPACRLFAQRSQDAEQLGRAIEYFSSAKYHEALLILDRLNKQYTLNPRYLAYLGVCHYYEWNYAEAIQYLDKAIPQLSAFSPHERSFYYWSNAESHFLLGRYDEAIPLYEKMLNLCYEMRKRMLSIGWAFATCLPRIGKKPATIISRLPIIIPTIDRKNRPGWYK